MQTEFLLVMGAIRSCQKSRNKKKLNQFLDNTSRNNKSF